MHKMVWWTTELVLEPTWSRSRVKIEWLHNTHVRVQRTWRETHTYLQSLQVAQHPAVVPSPEGQRPGGQSFRHVAHPICMRGAQLKQVLWIRL